MNTAGDLWSFLRTYTTHIEQVSVDECYMDFTEIADRFTSPVEGANEIKDEVYEKVRIHGKCGDIFQKSSGKDGIRF